MTVPDISIVCPCYNEEGNVEAIAAAVIAELEACQVSFEYLFIDNHSSDRTVDLIKAMCARDPRIKLIANTRNFGQMRSPTHCIYQTRGRAVIGIASDFQDPPDLIPEFVRRWRGGAMIVLGTRIAEQASPGLRLARRLSYGFLGRFGDYSIVPNATGFGLYDRRVVDACAALNEPEPFFRGMLVETGFPIETVPHARQPRAKGASKNNFFRLLDFALSGLAGSAKRLLRLPFAFAALSGALFSISALALLVAAIRGTPMTGWAISAIVELNFAFVFLFLALIGDQVRLISERTRGTPLVVERERVNFDE